MELDKDSFENEIREVDSRLTKKNVPAPSRPIQATIAIFKSHKVSGPIAHPFEKNLNYPVTTKNLSNHVNAWYSENYGDKIKVDPSPGQFPLLIENTAYKCRIPLIFGSFTVLAAKGHFSDSRVLNAVDHITDLTEYMRGRLSGEAEANILAIFTTCYEVTNELRGKTSEFLTSGVSDIHTSCELLCGYKPNPSLSAWHSLQFAEKCLKEYISQYERPVHTHNITSLVGTAQKYGYNPDKRLDFSLFNFGPSVRYSNSHFVTNQAVSINHEAWKLAFNVLKQI